MSHSRLTRLLATAAVGATVLSIAVSSASATGHPPIAFGPVGGRAAVNPGETFFKATAYNVSFAAGQTMTWSGNADGTGGTVVDDVAIIQVKHANGTKSKLTLDYSHGCTALTVDPPRDISSLFLPGLNTVTVTYKDKCGGNVSAESAYLS
jgi:hypothetical protein